MTRIHRFESVKNESKKLRKIKDLDLKRSHSVQDGLKDLKNESPKASRTRSVSPDLYVPPLAAKLPLKKFYKLYSKILVQLETVKNLLGSKKNENDNLEDLRRQLRRSDEFSIRFSRNNLYETKRIINEIKNLIVPYPFETRSRNECRILSKKIIVAYQAASHSLQIYINYAKNPYNLDIPDKITELVLLVADLFLCCEQLSLPADDILIQNDGVKTCNELLALLNSKTLIGDFPDFREMELPKRRPKPVGNTPQNMKKFSMYRTKLTNTSLKGKGEVSRKKFGVSCLFENRTLKKLKKKDEKKARITHEIYTRKMNQGKGFGSKVVKFEPLKMCDEKGENVSDRKLLMKSKYFTPREVRSQDDDVVTMIQTIGDDEMTAEKNNQISRREEEDYEFLNNINKSGLRELLVEAFDDLKINNRKDQKETLKKLLDSIQHYPTNENNSPRPPKVKVFHFKSKDLEEEEKAKAGDAGEAGRGCGGDAQKDAEESEDSEPEPKVDLVALHAQKKSEEEILAKERRLNIVFKPAKQSKRAREKADLNVVPRGKIKLKLSEKVMKQANKYKKSFAEYRKKNIMYRKTIKKKPWELLKEVTDQIILEVIKEISLDLQNDSILRRLFLNELLEVVT